MQYIDLDKKPALAAEVLDIYNEAFPAEERRPFANADEFLEFLRTDRFHVLVAIADCAVAGFVSWWDFRDIAGYSYVEHLAVDTRRRNGGIGASLIKELKDYAGDSLLLEVEPEGSTPLAERRIGFYRRLGFKTRPEMDYIQPPYAPGLPGVPLLLMTKGGFAIDTKPLLQYVYLRL